MFPWQRETFRIERRKPRNRNQILNLGASLRDVESSTNSQVTNALAIKLSRKKKL